MTDLLTNLTAPPSPAEHASEFAAHTGLRERTEPPVVPDVLRGSLEHRARLLRDGTVGEEELRRTCDDWSRRADSRYRATATLRATRDFQPGRWIRLGVKDTIDVAGMPTGLGLRHHRTYPARSAPGVTALLSPESDVAAKVVTTELNVGIGSGCVNPWFPHLSPAGSSSGSAVAVAANICDLGIGNDILGSVRWPAANCGLVGLRLTHDVSLLGGSLVIAPFLAALGLIARSAADLRYAARDRLAHIYGEAAPVRRIAIPAELTLETCHPLVRKAFERGCELLTATGVQIIEAACRAWAHREAAWQHVARAAAQTWDVLGPLADLPVQTATDQVFADGRAISDDTAGRLLGELIAARQATRADMAALGIDGWLLPVDPVPPRHIGPLPSGRTTIPASGRDADYEARVGFTPVGSIGGLPTVTVPVLCDPVLDAPFSVQVSGLAGADVALVDLACGIERADPFGVSERLPR